jgi:hypothetical protein
MSLAAAIVCIQAHRKREFTDSGSYDSAITMRKADPAAITALARTRMLTAAKPASLARILALTTIEAGEFAGRHNSPKCTPMVGTHLG